MWYPPPYFTAMGGETLLRLLDRRRRGARPAHHADHLRSGKKRLKFDLAIIAALQVAALAYGSYVMFEARPVYNVFVEDRFETVAANSIDRGSLDKAAAEFRTLPLTGPRSSRAQPADRAEARDITMSAVTGGRTSPTCPQFYVPYAQSGRDAAKAATPLASLCAEGAASAAGDRRLRRVANGNGARSWASCP